MFLRLCVWVVELVGRWNRLSSSIYHSIILPLKISYMFAYMIDKTCWLQESSTIMTGRSHQLIPDMEKETVAHHKTYITRIWTMEFYYKNHKLLSYKRETKHILCTMSSFITKIKNIKSNQQNNGLLRQYTGSEQ